MITRYVPNAFTSVARKLGIGFKKPIGRQSFEALYVAPCLAVPNPQKVFHLGHSLVGPDMPEMLMQLAGEGHSYSSQIGWGTPLRAHWEPEEPINGFEVHNLPDSSQDAREAIALEAYDSLVLTEMVEIRAAVRYFDSAKYLHKWIELGRRSNPAMRIFLYETWHTLDDKEGWLNRIDRDLDRYWEKSVLRCALAYEDQPKPVYIIPAGQVMARFVREVESRGGVGKIVDRRDLFSDEVHLTDYGTYLVALTHFAVLYQKSPLGLPFTLNKADGKSANSPGPEAARLMQEVVWDVVTKYAPTGVRPEMRKPPAA